MPTITPPLDQLTMEEKLQLVETIWANTTEHENELESPAWHEEVLRERERQVETGEARFIPLDEVMENLRRRAEARKK